MTYHYAPAQASTVSLDEAAAALEGIRVASRVLGIPEPPVAWLVAWPRRAGDTRAFDYTICGVADEDTGTISIVTGQGVESVFATAAHEVRHIAQFRRGEPLSEDEAWRFEADMRAMRAAPPSPVAVLYPKRVPIAVIS